MGIALSLLWMLLATVAGMSLTTFVRIRFQFLERLVAGLFVGNMAATLTVFLVGLLFGTGAGTLWGGLLLLLLGGLWFLLRSGGLGPILFEFRELRLAPRLSHLWLVLTVVPWALYFTVMFARAYRTEPDGLYAGYVNIWGDWSAHLTFASSFAGAHNLPPVFPILSGHGFSYPFMVDFLAGMLTFNGLSVLQTLPLTSAVLAIALVALFYFSAARLAGDRLAGFFAPTIFLLGSGLGFVYLLNDLDQAITTNGGWAAFLLHLPREYTLDRDINFQWLNPVLAYLIPQRSVLFGLAVGLLVMVLLFEGMRRGGRREMGFAGVLVALTPPFHLHATAAMGLVAGLVFLVTAWSGGIRSHLKLWLPFFIPALLVGVPLALSMVPPNPAGLDFLKFRPGWLAWEYGGKAEHDGFIWFWFKNLGLFIPLGLVALALWDRFRPGLIRLLAPFWILFIIPNLYILQPWEWDNTKWFLFWYLATAVLLGAMLAWLSRRSGAGRVLAAGLLFLLCLTGAADVWRSLDYPANRVRLLTTEEVALADWARTSTPPTAIFLTGDQHNHPIPLLAGRMIFKGYPGWLYTYHLEYLPQERLAQEMYDTYGQTPDDRRADLLRTYHIAYVVVGPHELAADGLAAKEPFFASHYQLAFHTADYRVYRTGT